jgi:hypothetical protein
MSKSLFSFFYIIFQVSAIFNHHFSHQCTKAQRSTKETYRNHLNEKLLRGVQMLHGAVFSKRAPWPPEAQIQKVVDI